MKRNLSERMNFVGNTSISGGNGRRKIMRSKRVLNMDFLVSQKNEERRSNNLRQELTDYQRLIISCSLVIYQTNACIYFGLYLLAACSFLWFMREVRSRTSFMQRLRERENSTAPSNSHKSQHNLSSIQALHLHLGPVWWHEFHTKRCSSRKNLCLWFRSRVGGIRIVYYNSRERCVNSICAYMNSTLQDHSIQIVRWRLYPNASYFRSSPFFSPTQGSIRFWVGGDLSREHASLSLQLGMG